MEVITVGDNKEIVIDPAEKDIIKKADEELQSLRTDSRKIIEEVLSHHLNIRDFSMRSPYSLQQIAKSLEVVLTGESAIFILNTVPNTSNIKTIIHYLKSEGLIHENTANLLQILSAKYGTSLHDFISISKKRRNWSQISSDGVISDEIYLTSKIWLIDGSFFEFDSPLIDGVTFANHFIERTFDVINNVNRELILEFKKDKLSELEKNVNKLRELYESVEMEINKSDSGTSETRE